MTRRPLLLLALLAACAPSLDKADPGLGGEVSDDGLEGDDGGDDEGGDGEDDEDGDDGGEDCRNLLVSTSALQWSEGIIGLATELSLTLTNTCSTGDTLRLGVQQTGAPTFTAVAPTDLTLLELAPGESIELRLAYAPDDYLNDEGLLTIADSRGLLENKLVQLLGAASGDQDGDGADAEVVGGADCDDSDPTISPYVGDTRADLADDDCDGLVDEDLVVAGDVMVTEIFNIPESSDPAAGEWFEVQNLSDTTIDLANWTVRDASGASFTLPAPLLAAPGARMVIAGSMDASANGGLAAAAAFGGSFSLDDAADAVILDIEGRVIHSVSYDGGWAQRVGRSMSLDRDFVDPVYAADPDYWCTAYSVYGAGDYGTPAGSNNLCGNVDHDFDGYSLNDGDCDDNDPSLYPGAIELWDGLDNDCDGLVDGQTTASASGWVVGDAGDQLGYADGLSIGDVDSDGLAELMMGGSMSSTGSTRGGIVYGVEVGDLMVAAGTAASALEFATIEGTTTYGSLGVMPAHMPDVDGDGGDDLLIAGASYYGYTYGGTAAAIYFNGSVTGSIDDDEADVLFENSQAYASSTSNNAVAALDMDGDGADDVALGVPQTYSYGGGSTSYYLGMATVYLGGGLELGDELDETDADLYLSGSATSDNLGGTVGGGDLDGDGYDELVVGAPGDDLESTNGGAVYIFAGSPDPSDAGEGSALAVAAIGGSGSSDAVGDYADPVIADFDGDGNADLAISSTTDGEVYVFWSAGSLSGTLETNDADLQLDGDGPNAFGYALEVGDVDGDGDPELLVGAPDGSRFSYASTGTFSTEGEVSVFAGSLMAAATKLDSSDASFTLRETSASGFGAAISAADTDGDGDAEVFVAAPGVPVYTSGTYSYPTGTVWGFDPR